MASANVIIFNSSNLIDAVQNECVLWDLTKSATEEEKELAWQRIGDVFGITNGNFRTFWWCA